MSPIDRTSQLIAHVSHLYPDTRQVEERLADDPDVILASAFPENDPAFAPPPTAPAAAGFESAQEDELAVAVRKRRRKVLDDGRSAMRKLQAEGPSTALTPAESVGLEAIVLTVGRPAILFQNGHFGAPPPEWSILENARDGIERAARSVGRIQLQGVSFPPYIGTGFLVGSNAIMTNRHVAQFFSASGRGNKWVFKPGVVPLIDYVENPDADPPMEFTVEGVIGIHDTFDLALLGVAHTSGSGVELSPPLTLASGAPGSFEGRNVYALGYPARDPRNGAELMRQIFGDIFGVKRLQPGQMMTSADDQGLFKHDCSTLGGNSGSCILDLDSHQVIGLHFQGFFLQFNQAVALWKLRDDPLLKKAKANFA